jgi:predicted esterase
MFVPPIDDDLPMRLVVLLHGAGGVAATALELLRPHAEARRLLLVAPKSTGATWDVISGGYGPDARIVDELLRRVCDDYPVDRFSIAGFSDGASYALSLGLDNGELFDSVVAFSPGFSAAQDPRGRPRIFVSHGTDDQVLPIDRCSRRLVPLLRRRHSVTYSEFQGGHSVPESIRRKAADWLTGPEATA